MINPKALPLFPKLKTPFTEISKQVLQMKRQNSSSFKKLIQRTEEPKVGGEKQKQRQTQCTKFISVNKRCCHGDVPLVVVTMNAMCQRDTHSCSKVTKVDHKTKT